MRRPLLGPDYLRYLCSETLSQRRGDLVGIIAVCSVAEQTQAKQRAHET